MTTEFRTLTDVIQAIAKRGTDAPPTTERAYYAHCLFTKASLHARSIVSLCDSSLQREEQPDVGGICVLARCLIEVRNATSYLLESNISKNEAHLRLHLVSLNQSVDLLRVTRGLETNRDDFWSEHSITYSRGELAGNPIFAALDPNQKKYLLRGKSPLPTITLSRQASSQRNTRVRYLHTSVSQRPCIRIGSFRLCRLRQRYSGRHPQFVPDCYSSSSNLSCGYSPDLL